MPGLQPTTSRDGREDELVPALSDAACPGDAHVMVDRALAWVTEDPEMLPPPVHLDATDRRFRFGSVEEIFAALENKGTDRVSDTLKNLRHMSPTCSQDELEAHEAGAELSFADAMTMEYGMSWAFIRSLGQGHGQDRGQDDGEAAIRVAGKAFSLAEKVNLDHQRLFDISSRSCRRCWSLDQRRPVPGPVPASLPTGLQPGSTAEMMLKDLKLAWPGDWKIGTATPWERKLRRFTRCSPISGSGKLDFSAIIKMLRGTC